MDLRANTAVDVLIGPFVDEDDGKTAETGLTITQADVKLSKNGQALAQKSDANAAAHDANGYHNCPLNATDLNTEGNLVLIVHESGALPVRHEFNVLSEAAWDSLYAAKDTGYMNVNIKALGDSTQSVTDLKDFADTGYDPATHRARANLEEILGHLLTQTGTQVADGFEHFFDHATPAITVGDAMVGTDNAALASVVGALNNAAAAGNPTDADTLMQYLKQLVNVLVGTVGIPAFPAEAGPANNVSLAEVIRAIHADVTGLNGSAMIGTNSAATAAKLLAYIQLLARSDAAITTDNATELTEINANEGSGIGDYAATTESQEALRDRGDAGWVTASGMSTHSAADVWSAADRTLSAPADYKADVSGLSTHDAAAVVTALGTGSTLTDCLTAAGFSTHDAAAVVTAIGTGSTLTDCLTAAGFSTHDAAAVVTALGTGSTLTGCLTASGFSTHDAAAVKTTIEAAGSHLALILADTGTDGVKIADIETGVTHQQALQRIGAVVAGIISGAGTGTETFKGMGVATDRVQVTVDASGNRSVVDYDP